MIPRRAGQADLAPTLALIRNAFAGMDGVIDPPSSAHRLTLDDLRDSGALWVIGTPPHACVVLTPKPPVLYLGKLAVAADRRGTGLARRLVDLAVTQARAMALAAVELQVRVELTGNLAAFAAMGFTEVARTAHPGYDRPTSVTLRRTV